jgi:copper chaperone CopZ
MESFSLKVPAMYGDHHVIAARELLLNLAGVTDVYASSSFRLVEVQYDPTQITPQEIESTLDEAGYLGELPLPAETNIPATERRNGQPAFFRHTAAYVQTGRTISFAQKLPDVERPLWPCPGMGVVRSEQ